MVGVLKGDLVSGISTLDMNGSKNQLKSFSHFKIFLFFLRIKRDVNEIWKKFFFSHSREYFADEI